MDCFHEVVEDEGSGVGSKDEEERSGVGSRDEEERSGVGSRDEEERSGRVEYKANFEEEGERRKRDRSTTLVNGQDVKVGV